MSTHLSKTSLIFGSSMEEEDDVLSKEEGIGEYSIYLQLTLYHQYQCLKCYNITVSIGKTSNVVAINSEATVTTEQANEISAGGVSSSRRVTFKEPSVKSGNEEVKAGATFVKRGSEEVKAGATFVTPPPPVVNKRRSEATSAEPRASPSNHVKETPSSSSNHVKEMPSILDVFDDADDDIEDDKNSDEDPHDSSEDDNMDFAIKVASDCDSSSSSDAISLDVLQQRRITGCCLIHNYKLYISKIYNFDCMGHARKKL